MPDMAMPESIGLEAAATLRRQPRAAQFVFRGQSEALRLAGEAFGLALPQTACRAAWNGERAALWQGPDEWLLIAPAAQEDDIEAGFRNLLAGQAHALVGVGHRNATLDISGPRGAELLNAGCPLDLDEAAFPVGMCTRTILAKAPILLWRTAPEDFVLGAWRSFMPYVWDFLIEARARL
jgi:sarcosine oxidase subunit gamma